MNCNKASHECLTMRKLTSDFINFEQDEDDQIKTSRGRKMNNYYLNSCEHSCKNTACDSTGKQYNQIKHRYNKIKCQRNFSSNAGHY